VEVNIVVPMINALAIVIAALIAFVSAWLGARIARGGQIRRQFIEHRRKVYAKFIGGLLRSPIIPLDPAYLSQLSSEQGIKELKKTLEELRKAYYLALPFLEEEVRTAFLINVLKNTKKYIGIAEKQGIAEALKPLNEDLWKVMDTISTYFDRLEKGGK
jgi:hypothetical protein